MASELDALLDQIAEERGGQAMPSSRDLATGPSVRQLRHRRKHAQDWDEHHLKKVIEVKLDLAHAPPLHKWRYQRPQEVVERLFGEVDYSSGFLHRAGRALSQIAREYPAVEKQFRNGRSRYLLPEGE